MTLRYLWQLPQNLLALMVIRATDARYHGGMVAGAKIYVTSARIGVCLGEYIIMWRDAPEPLKTIAHEAGHYQQSLLFGPLYLIIIGIPSLLMNVGTRLHLLKRENYYKRWPESWADTLGKVER